jgi:ABC-type transporter Mla MlaB component
MLRITVVESSKIAVTLRVEGRITGPWVEELRTACNVHTVPDNVQLSLELADVSFADAAGIALLKELRSRGVGLIRATPFLAEQLKDGASHFEF